MAYGGLSTAKVAPAQLACLFLVIVLVCVGLLHLGNVHGDQLPQRSITFSRAAPGITDQFVLQFKLPAPITLGSIKLEFCTEGALIGTPCTGPAGFKLTTGTLDTQTGENGFSISPASTDNTLVLTRAPAVTTATDLSYTMTGVTNPANAGTYYARLQLYASNDASGSAIDYGGFAFAIFNGVAVSATVPPYLYFCLGLAITDTDCTTATGNYINFGDFTTVAASSAQTQMVAGTNAQDGYTIIVNGTTLTSGINVIPALATPDVSRPGTSQFGINLAANVDPAIGQNPSGGGSGSAAAGYGIANEYKFVPGDIVAGNPGADLPRKYTTSYVANVAKNQAPGIYVSTLTYVATGSF